MNTKICANCKKEYPATLEFFYAQKGCKYDLTGYCKECYKEKSRAWHKRTNTERRKYYSQRYKNNKEEILKRQKEYGKRNKEVIKEKNKKYAKKNKHKISQYHKEHYQKNKDKIKEKVSTWKKENKLKVKVSTTNRKTKKKGVYGTFTEDDILAIKQLQNNKCRYCNKVLSESFHVDHFIPLSAGGHNDKENLVISCPTCNLTKFNKLPWLWLDWNGRFPVFWNDIKNI